MASKTTRRGWWCTPSHASRQLRVVGQRRADAHGDRVHRRAPAVRPRPAGLVGDPLRVARAGGDLAVQRHRRLEQHPRPPGARVLAEGLVDQPGAVGELAVGDVDLDALVAQDPQAAAGRLLARVVGGDDDAARSRRRGSRRCTAASCRGGSTAPARRTSSPRRGRRRRRRRSPRPRRADRRARRASPRPTTTPSRDDHRADQRVGVHAPEPVGGELDRAREVLGWSVSVVRRHRSPEDHG